MVKPLSDNTVGELITTKPTYIANTCLFPDQDGLVTASTITSDELNFRTGTNNNINERLDELAGLLTGLDYSQFREVITSNC